MITGRALSEMIVREQIQNGLFARNKHDAIRKFGVQFVAVSPIYASCIKLLATCSPEIPEEDAVEKNCVYVKSPK